MTDSKAEKIIKSLYDTINTLLFSGTLPPAIVKLENENPRYIGAAAFDIETVVTRLDEIKKHGNPATPLKCVLSISRAHITDDYLDTLIALTDTILHEAVHFDTMGDCEHGEDFKRSARAHGLDIITDENGNYKNTRIQIDTLSNILDSSNLIQRKAQH